MRVLIVLFFSDCKPLTHTELSCVNDTLTVTWPADITYNATVTQIPYELLKRLTDRLLFESRHPILSLVITSQNPP